MPNLTPKPEKSFLPMQVTIAQVIYQLHQWAPPAFAEDYDNVGLITGDKTQTCTGVLCCLDALPEIVDEAVALGCNLIVAHHPILFRKINSLAGDHYALESIRRAIRAQVAILSLHTNLDNVYSGVNRMFAEKLGLLPETLRILDPKPGLLCKLYTFVPTGHLAAVQEALFAAGAGGIGQYTECGFSHQGVGTFRPGAHTNPVIGQAGGPRETVAEDKLEVIFEKHQMPAILHALKQAHPYEEVAYDMVDLLNVYHDVGSGMVGKLAEGLPAEQFLKRVAETFELEALRYTPGAGGKIQTVAVCGGAGSFLISKAKAAKADAFITADLKYHEYFEAGNHMMLLDIGHYESECHVIEGMVNQLKRYFTTFAVLSTRQVTNPTRIFVPH